METESNTTPGIPMDQCVRGRLYRFRARNFEIGVYDGKQGFIGIRTKFGSRYLATEYHWDQGAPFGTVREVVDTGVDCPPVIVLSESLGTEDSVTGRSVHFDRPVVDGGAGWVFDDDDSPCPPEARPVNVSNSALFSFLDGLGT